jgi:putative nucleotidyltransferase with HDIG domain
MSILIPVVAATLAGLAMGNLLPEPSTGLGVTTWWAAVIATIVIVMKVFDRLGRRLLPMVWLLRMTMAFPDEAPSRLQVMMRSGVVSELRERIHSAHVEGEPDLAEVSRNILTLATALSKHDGTTRSHSERVQAYADLLGRELGLTEGDRDRLRWAALLHDVGKLAVPSEILNKEGPPTDEEWAVIRTHPQEGMKIIAPLAPWLGPWAKTIEHHHEWYDGSGYPYGLVGDDIAMGARMVSVADAYDTITSRRAYKKPLSAEAARHEVAASAGTHFDPKVVRALFNVSLGKLRWIIGPAAWLAQLPFLGGLDRLGRDAAVLLATVAAFITLVAGGVVALPGTIGDDPSVSVEAGASGGVVAPDSSADSDRTDPTGGAGTVGTAVDARPDAATTAEDTPIAVAVLGNDGGVSLGTDGSSLTVVGSPESGSTDVAGEEVVYTPDPDFHGGDEFTYRVCSGPDECAQASVSIQVTAVNDAPRTNPDTGTADATDPVSLTPLANDSDPDGDQLTVGAALAEAGSVVVNPNGTVTYTAPAGFRGADVVSYSACDPSGSCSAGTMNINVTAPDPVDPPESSTTTVVPSPVNQPPVAPGTSLTVAEDQTVSWLPDVADPDGDDLSCLVVSGPASGLATIALDCANGTYAPAPDFTGLDEFTIVVSDGATAVTAAVAVSVTAVEDGPVASADLAGTPIGTGVHIDVVANDFDPEGGQLEIVSISSPSVGSAELNTSGTVTYLPPFGFTGVDSFSYEVCDPGGTCAIGVVTITVG